MMDFITIPAVLTVIGYFIYKLFELFVCKKERLYMIEHAKDFSVNGIDGKFYNQLGLNLSFSALKWGAFILGIGLGLIVAYFININTTGAIRSYEVWQRNEMMGVIYGGCTLLFGGLGLVAAFITEIKLKNKKLSE